MVNEKPQPLYNENGQVNDPEIAKKMAGEENFLRTHPDRRRRMGIARGMNPYGPNGVSKEEVIDDIAKDVGEYELLKKNLAEKIKSNLSEEEIRLFLEDPDTIISRLKK